MCILGIRTPTCICCDARSCTQSDPFGGSRYADVFGVRVREWMPAMHYGAQAQASTPPHRYLHPKPTVVSEKRSIRSVVQPNLLERISAAQWSLTNYYLVKGVVIYSRCPSWCTVTR